MTATRRLREVPNPTLSVSLSPAVLARALDASTAVGLPLSLLVERAIEQYLAEHRAELVAGGLPARGRTVRPPVIREDGKQE